MDEEKKKRLAKAGWRTGDVADFLELTPEEEAFIEVKLALARHLRKLRADAGLTQEQAAKRLSTSQSRLAKMEAADPTVSIDLLVKALLTLGATLTEVGRVIGKAA